MSAVTPPIKVTHIASGDLWAGAEAQLFTLAKALHQSNEASVNVILLNHGELEKRLREQGILVDVIPENELNGFQIFIQLKNLLKQKRPDVVHTHRIKENILGGLAARFAGNIPSMRTAHGASEHSPSWFKPHKRILYSLDWFVGRFLQKRIIAVSEDLAVILKQDFPADKIVIIENGVDIETLNPYVKERNTPRKEPANPIKIGLVGRLVPVKRVDIFIKTAKYLRDHYLELNAEFHIFGDGPLREELEQLSISLGINNNVHFEGHCDDIHQRLGELDLLLLTSDHEGLPMILLEAMTLGVPIISHAIGGIPKLLYEGTCGMLVTDHSKKGYATALYHSIKHPESLQKFARLAFDQVAKNYTAKINATTYVAVYKTTLK